VRDRNAQNCIKRDNGTNQESTQNQLDMSKVKRT